MEQNSLTKGRKEKEIQTGFLFLQLPKRGQKSAPSDSQLSPTPITSPTRSTSPGSSKAPEVSISLDELSPQGIRRPSFSSIALSEPDTVRATTTRDSRPVSFASTCQPLVQNSMTGLSGTTLTNNDRTNSHKSHSHPSPKKPSRIKSRLEGYKTSIAQQRPFQKIDSRPSYKPFWLRPGPIVFLLLASFSLIGLIEVARKIVPTINGGTAWPNADFGDDYYKVFGGKPIYNDRLVQGKGGGEHNEITTLERVEEEQDEEPVIERRVLSTEFFPAEPTSTYIALRAVTFNGPAFATVTPTLDKSEDCVEAYGYCRLVATDDPSECPAMVSQWEDDFHPTMVTSDNPCLTNLLGQQRYGKCKYFITQGNSLWPPGLMMHEMQYYRGRTNRCERLGAQLEEEDLPVIITVSGLTTSTITTEVGGTLSTFTEGPSSAPSSMITPGSSPSPSSAIETSPLSSSPTSSSSTTSPMVTRIGGSTITTETVVTVPILTITRDDGNMWGPEAPTNISSITVITSEVTLTNTDASGSQTVITTVISVPSAISTSSSSGTFAPVPVATTTSSNGSFPVTVVPLIDPIKGETTGSLTQTLIFLNNTAGTPTLTLAKFITTNVVTLDITTTDVSGSTYFSDAVTTQTQTRYLTSPGIPRPTRGTYNGPGPNLTDHTNLARPVTKTGYFVGAFVPALLAVLLGIPIGILNMHIKRMAPFMMLSRGYTSTRQADGHLPVPVGRVVPDSREVVARDSLLLSIEGIYGPFRSMRLLWTYGFAAGFLGDLLTWCSGLLIAISKDVLYVEVSSFCIRSGDPDEVPMNQATMGCFMYLSMRLTPMRAAQVLLIFMACLILGLGWIFWIWNTGAGGYYQALRRRVLRRDNAIPGIGGRVVEDDGRVKGNGGVMLKRNPWSIAGMLMLLAGSSTFTGEQQHERGEESREGLKGLLKRIDTPVVNKEISRKEMAKAFDGWKFALRTEAPTGEVGIRMIKEPSMPAISSQPKEKKRTWIPAMLARGFKRKRDENSSTQVGAQQQEPEESHVTQRQILGSTTYWNFDFPALCLHVGLLILILYYQNNHYDTTFERWMNSDAFGVHFLFSGMGFLIGLFWDGLFSSEYL